MRVLGPIVLPSTTLMMALDPEIEGGSARRAQIIRDHPIGNEAIFLQKLAHQFQRSMLVSLGLDQDVEDFPFSVHGSPKIDHAASDLAVDLIKMPCRVRLRTTLAQVRCDHRPKVVHPAPDCLV